MTVCTSSCNVWIFFIPHIAYTLVVSICSLHFTVANIKVIKNFIKENEYSAFVAPLGICIGLVLVMFQDVRIKNLTLYYIAYQTASLILTTVLLLSIYCPKVIYCTCMYDYVQQIHSLIKDTYRKRKADKSDSLIK